MRLPILMYHALDRGGSAVSVSPEMFRRHLGRLRASGYTLLPLGEALDHARAGTTTARIAACTFDDGYASVVEHAAPLLESFGWRATVFAISSYVGGENQWPSQTAAIPRARLASWSDLRDLAAKGWEIGAHTRTHPPLPGLDPATLESEIVGGKRDLEERLGQAVTAFAYPYGDHDRQARALVRDTFSAACTTKMGWASGRSAPNALERIEMWYFAQPGLHRLLGSPLMGLFVAACEVARRRKRPHSYPAAASPVACTPSRPRESP